jgi:hypothetical protein
MPQHYADPSGSALPPQGVTPAPTPDNSATIALLERWTGEDASDDPATIARAEKELAQLKAALNANRPPESPVFP